MTDTGVRVAPSTHDPVEGRAARFGTLVAAVWLLFLVGPLLRHWDQRGDPLVLLAYASTLAFAAAYVLLFELLRHRRVRLELGLPLTWSASLIAVLTVCWLGMLAGFGQDGSGAVVFIAVSAAMALPTVHAGVTVLVLAAVAAAVSVLQTGWERDLEFPFLAVVAGFVMWAVRQLLTSNVELLRTRQENEALLVEQERNRFARDLHDVLGHSLTVIAVKAELAQRLLEVDQGRAASELADVERLSRDALADVRRAVQGYREITLPGELARARGALAAAGIRADLPSSADDVAGELRELFAWTIREAVTNIVRHSRARSAEIALTATTVRVTNDGVRERDDRVLQDLDGGTGLRGLRERVEAMGGRLRVERTGPHFTIEVAGQ